MKSVRSVFLNILTGVAVLIGSISLLIAVGRALAYVFNDYVVVIYPGNVLQNFILGLFALFVASLMGGILYLVGSFSRQVAGRVNSTVRAERAEVK